MKIVKCDICGSTEKVMPYSMPVYRTHDGCDGLTCYSKPKISFKTIDICEDCLTKSTNIYDDTVMGYGNMVISANPELKQKKEEQS